MGEFILADNLIEYIITIAIILIAVVFTIFDLPGNTILIGTSMGFAFFETGKYFDLRLLSAMILVYALGEIWEIAVAFLGIKKEKISWKGVFFISIGTFLGTLAGTMVFPILGSIIGGMIGAFVFAFIWDYSSSKDKANAFDLAWQAAKMQIFALFGKLVATFAMSVLLIRQIFYV